MTTIELPIIEEPVLTKESAKKLVDFYKKYGFRYMSNTHYELLADFYLKEIYHENVSIFDYSVDNFLPFYMINIQGKTKFKTALKKSNPTKYRIVTARESHKVEQIEQIIKDVISKKLTLLDYCHLTKLHPLILDEELAQYKKYDEFKTIYGGLISKETSLEEQLKISYITTLGKVSDEIKTKAFDYIDENDIIKNIATYKEVAKKLQKEDTNTTHFVL